MLKTIQRKIIYKYIINISTVMQRKKGCGREERCLHYCVDARELLEHVESAAYNESTPGRRIGQHAPQHWAICRENNTQNDLVMTPPPYIHIQ